MAIEIVNFPIKHGGSFHSYVAVYQRVTWEIFHCHVRFTSRKRGYMGILYFFLGKLGKANCHKPTIWGGVVVKKIQTKGHVGLVYIALFIIWFTLWETKIAMENHKC